MPEYSKKTVVELQEILKGRSLPHTGKKADLVARLTEADKSVEAKTDETPAPPTKPAPEANVKAATPVAKSVSAEQVPQEPAAPTTTTDTTTLDPPPTDQTDREGSANTDAKLATAVDYSIGLDQSSFEDEMKKRKARAERFGVPAEEPDAEARKADERAKRFGTGTAANGGVGKLDEALPVERERRGKREREGENGIEDPGLRQGRGGKRRFQGRRERNDKRGGKPTGVQKSASKPAPAFSSERDRAAAEARKKKFATG